LQYGEDQHAVIRVQFQAQWNSEKRTVRVRLLWSEGTSERETPWQELHFSYASDKDCDEETRAADVVQVVSLQEADYARREAIARSNRGDVAGARAVLQQAASRVERNAPAAPALQAEISALEAFSDQMANAPLPPSVAKEQYYQQQRRSRNKADYRQSNSIKEEEKA
jgi:hypothetical protein